METLSQFFSFSKPSTPFTESGEIKFFVANEEHTVKVTDISTDTTLNDYLRKTVHLMGTKNMCLEGGCGACIVVIAAMDPVTEREELRAVNSCLVPIYCCSGWKIHTIESIGNEKLGYHPVQKAVVQFSGTQCGFCTSGMIMNMYALYESGDFKMKDVENSFGGNICRCTGYRPILSGFKSLASDADTELLGTVCDIEDIPLCKKNPGTCQKSCSKTEKFFYNLGKTKWMKVFSVNEILDVLKENPESTFIIVGGNTAKGVYKKVPITDIYIDISSVKTLHEHYMDSNSNLILGANMSITNAMNLFYRMGGEQRRFSYLTKMADHIDLIANVPVRNAGTLAGNLMIKHEHNEFPSDVFLILETVGATLILVDINGKEISISLLEFITLDIKNKIIRNIILPPLDETYKYESYKIMPRAQNAHAIVNAGFLLKLDNEKVESARIVYGCINSSFTHATETEKFLIGKDLFNNGTLQNVFETLEKELNTDHVPPEPSPIFRKKLAIALCYKYILSITPDNKISPQNRSGSRKQTREISKGSQDYETNQSLYPLTQPIPKLEALAQSTGQAQYVGDIIEQPGQLYAVFVQAKAPANSIIKNIDTAEALAMKDVAGFFDKNDLSGRNTFTPPGSGFNRVDEEIFCSGVVKHYFQPVGVIVATSQEVAEKAAEAVNVTYTEGKEKPLITIRDIIESKNQNKIFKEMERPATSKGNDVKHVIHGKFDIFGQYHYHMEKQSCVVIPNEDNLDIFPTTQAMDFVQHAVSESLKIPCNKINISVRRIGGGFGSKISRNCQIACAAALAAHKLKKPVQMILPLEHNMNIVGKRFPFSADYEVGVDDQGMIQYMKLSAYTDPGCVGINEPVLMEFTENLFKTYNSETWDVTVFSTRSDTPTNTWCRAPGSTEGVALMESIMDHIAYTIKKDPLEVRTINLSKEFHNIPKMIEDMKDWADIKQRKESIEKFNKENRWVKRGLSIVPMSYPFFYFGNYSVIISIYHTDGTVAISHGGIEMGQGINTKVAQVCAYTLGIPLDQISVKPSNVLTAPNSICSGGSITSESVCYATIKACEILLDRMKPIKEKMTDPNWLKIVQESYAKLVDLCATYMYHAALPDLKNYIIYGLTCSEVEVDLLTGLYQLKRVDIIEDAGQSMSPQVDIGQVEGAFVMGIGYWVTEQLVYNEKGELLTNRTWNYKPPGAKDIPIDFRVKFPKNNPNQAGVLKSKATAEPPLCMSCSVPLAIRNALSYARTEANPHADTWFPINGPTNVEAIFDNSLHDYKQYIL